MEADVAKALSRQKERGLILMWLLLTVIFAVAAYLAVIWFDSLIPALLFLAGAIGFAVVTWNTRSRRPR